MACEKNLRENMLLGMGNPLLDISAVVEENLLKKYELKENEAILATDKHTTLYTTLVDKYDVEYIAGGSVQNALRVCQWLLGTPNTVTFFGCVGEDEFSKILKDQAQKAGVQVNYQYTSTEPTGTCAVLVTNQHRTLCANLAAANCFTIDHIKKPENKKFIETAAFYYVSGFFLTVSPPTILEVAKYANENKRPFIMNLSAEFICKFYKEPFMQVMPYVDILFGNEAEALAFSENTDFANKSIKEIALGISKLPKEDKTEERIVIITQGTLPVILVHKGEIKEFPVISLPKESIIDTNGAGDAFVGGFLSQYIQGKSLEVCIKCGIWAATEIIQRSGCTFAGKPCFVEN
ncbi:adenosine kinase-like [Coccinella septempunctata]|uniref:adenosine kinase-like n=1 Tax=Coccinella septempunctata TaxID=41139 RepID=UPI001D0992BA|nr:adenosine kinase-like [Coccinella septempunctata]